jgi:hypothetical protein
MSQKYFYLLVSFLSAHIYCFCAYAIEWPILDSSHPQKILHRKIIGSIFGRPDQEYWGGRFKGNFFVIQGNGVDQQQNRELIQYLPHLRSLLEQSTGIQLFHTCTPEEITQFSQCVPYKIAVNNRVLPFPFFLYNRSKLAHFTPFVISHQEGPLIEGTSMECSLQNLDMLCSQQIETLKEKHRANNILQKVFPIIDGANLAIMRDQKFLLKTIQHYPSISITLESLLDLMTKDRDLITQAAQIFTPHEASNVCQYLPFLDQLHTLGNQGALCKHRYKGRKGIDEAMAYIRHNPILIEGIISDELQKTTGRPSIILRIVLFYIALEKTRMAGENFGPGNLVTFYKGDYLGSNPNVKVLLSQTSFFCGESFYTPSNGYLKNADYSNFVSDDSGPNPPQMVFTDCSGLAQYVTRHFHPTNQRLKNRILSRHLAAAYDAFANKQKETKNILYDLYGNNNRLLKAHEQQNLVDHSETIKHLKKVYEPVLNPIKTMQPGDILIERSAMADKEGHVMIIVEPGSPIIVAELTSGRIRGYRWRALELSNNTENRFHRVLRIKRP